MKKTKISLLSVLLAGMALFVCSFIPPPQPPIITSVVAYVDMGNPSTGADNYPTCDGMGLCSVSSSQSADPNGVSMTFTYNSNSSPQTIILSLDLTELASKQSDKVAALQSPNTTYTFTSGFNFLPAIIFSSLGLPSGAHIAANESGSITRSGQIATITVPLSF